MANTALPFLGNALMLRIRARSGSIYLPSRNRGMPSCRAVMFRQYICANAVYESSQPFGAGQFPAPQSTEYAKESLLPHVFDSVAGPQSPAELDRYQIS